MRGRNVAECVCWPQSQADSAAIRSGKKDPNPSLSPGFFSSTIVAGLGII
jgi:hypothetical protein